MFSLAPILVAFVYFLIGLLDHLFTIGLSSESLLYFITLPFMIFYSMLNFGIPSIILGLVYLLIDLHKGYCSYIFVFFVGGASAVLWADFIFNNFEYDLIASPGESAYYIFTQGTLSSLIISFFALPRKA